MRLAVLLVLAGCGKLIGLAPPHEQIDAAAIDGVVPPFPDAGPTMLQVVVNGTASGSAVVTANVGGIDCMAGSGTCSAVIPPSTRVTLTAGGTSSGTFVGFVGAPGCTGSATTCAFTPTTDTTVYARWFGGTLTNYIFVSSTVQEPGSFMEASFADALCQNLATAADVPQQATGSAAGAFRAWLSTSSESASTHLLDGVAGAQPALWSRVDGAPVALSLSDFDNGDFFFPPRLDELGRDVGDSALAVTDTTGTGGANGGTHCQDWAAGASPGQVLAGEPVGGTDRWTEVTTIACNQPAHIYCVNALADNPVLGIASPSGPIVWVSTGTVAGNAGVAAMDAVCSSESSAAHFGGLNFALVTPGGGQSVASRFAGDGFSGPPQRPDGPAIEPDMPTLLSGATFLVVPNVDSMKHFVDDVVWVGAGGFDNFATDCNGWTSSSGFGAARPVATTQDHTFFENLPCSESHRVWCVSAVIAMPSKPVGGGAPGGPHATASSNVEARGAP
jgi:hypothetical protein